MRKGAWVVLYSLSTGRILVARRGAAVNNPGSWNFLGGRINKGEKPREAAIRELYEEGKVRLKDGIRWGGKRLHKIMTVRKGQRELHAYLMLVPKEVKLKINFEHDLYTWVDIQDMPSSLNPPTRKLVDVGILDLVKELVEAYKEKTGIRVLASIN